MYKTASALIVLSLSPIQKQNDIVYDLSGDYSECAIEYLLKNKNSETFDPNDILYKTIIKELQEEKNFVP